MGRVIQNNNWGSNFVAERKASKYSTMYLHELNWL